MQGSISRLLPPLAAAINRGADGGAPTRPVQTSTLSSRMLIGNRIAVTQRQQLDLLAAQLDLELIARLEVQQ